MPDNTNMAVNPLLAVREHIVQAALIDDAGTLHTLPRPARHIDVARHGMNVSGADNFNGWQQGFITSRYRYVDRRTARALALLSDQIEDKTTRNQEELFSEDVW